MEKNWFIAMGKLDVLPHKLEEYAVLKFEMREFENKFARAKALTERLELQAKWETYCAMEPVYEKASTHQQQQSTTQRTFVDQVLHLFGDLKSMPASVN